MNVREEVYRKIGSGEFRQALRRAEFSDVEADQFIFSFERNGKLTGRFRRVANGEVRQALERASWSGREIDVLMGYHYD